MATGFYLLDYRPKPAQHWYTSRLGMPCLAIGMHITAGLQDLVGADVSAEQTAKYAATTDRQVSWHAGSDGDSHFRLLPDSYTAWAIRGYNKSTWNHEISLRSPDWRKVPAEARERLLRNAAKEVGPACSRMRIPIRKASKSELDREKARGAAGKPVGLISHWTLDPGRRDDPGRVGSLDTFPWAEFLGYCRQYANQEDDVALTDDDKKWLSKNIGPSADVVTIVGASETNPKWMVKSVLSDLHTRARGMQAQTAALSAAVDALAKALAEHDGNRDPEAFVAAVREAAAAGATAALEAMPLAAVLVREETETETG